MRQYRCVCENKIFYENSQCLACGRELGFCPACRQLVALEPHPDGGYSCSNAACGAELAKCFNYSQHNVCNRCVVRQQAGEAGLVRLLSIQRHDSRSVGRRQPGEMAPAGSRQATTVLRSGRARPALRHGGRPGRSAADVRLQGRRDPARPSSGVGRQSSEKVFTGHADGRITINIREADDVEREKLRVDFGEAHRTLIGHFRHEVGHYYWDQLVKGRREDECGAVFRRSRQPDLRRSARAPITRNGPPADWAQQLHQRLRHDASLGGFCRDLGHVPRHGQRARHGPPRRLWRRAGTRVRRRCRRHGQALPAAGHRAERNQPQHGPVGRRARGLCRHRSSKSSASSTNWSTWAAPKTGLLADSRRRWQQPRRPRNSQPQSLCKRVAVTLAVRQKHCFTTPRAVQ